MVGVPMKHAAWDFLSMQRIAVAGVSREKGSAHGGNVVYNRLRDKGYEVFAVNPKAETVEGDPAYHRLSDIPGGVQAVVIATPASATVEVMRDCIELGIDRVWMHRSFGQGSYSEEATALGREHGVRVIPGGCPLMFDPCSDGPHKFMKTVLRIGGRLPKAV